MRPFSGITAFCALVAISCAHAQTNASCVAHPADEAAVADTVRAMYAAFTTDDLAKFHSAATKDFLAFDGGRRYEGDALIKRLKQLHESGSVFVWTVNGPEAHIGCNDAWIAYVNRGTVTSGGKTTEVTWLESAVLVRDGDIWKIRFFHSTRVPPAAPPK